MYALWPGMNERFKAIQIMHYINITEIVYEEEDEIGLSSRFLAMMRFWKKENKFIYVIFSWLSMSECDIFSTLHGCQYKIIKF
jgi:hypothetical protein